MKEYNIDNESFITDKVAKLHLEFERIHPLEL